MGIDRETTTMTIPRKERPKKMGRIRRNLHLMSKQKALLAMSLPFLIWLFIFKYVPIWGWTMAFQDFKPARTFSEQEWV